MERKILFALTFVLINLSLLAQKIEGNFYVKTDIDAKDIQKYAMYHFFINEGLNELFAIKLVHECDKKLFSDFKFTISDGVLWNRENTIINYGILPQNFHPTVIGGQKYIQYSTQVNRDEYKICREKLKNKYNKINFYIKITTGNKNKEEGNKNKDDTIFLNLLSKQIETLLTSKGYNITTEENADFGFYINIKNLEIIDKKKKYIIKSIFNYEIRNKENNIIASTNIKQEDTAKKLMDLVNSQMEKLVNNTIYFGTNQPISLFGRFYNRCKIDDTDTIYSHFGGKRLLFLDPRDFPFFEMPDNINNLKIKITDNLGNTLKFFKKEKVENKIKITLHAGYEFIPGRVYYIKINNKGITLKYSKQ